jgi:hypothetical protein
MPTFLKGVECFDNEQAKGFDFQARAKNSRDSGFLTRRNVKCCSTKIEI